MSIRHKHKPVDPAVVHTGKLISAILKEQHVSVAQLAKRIGRNRDTVGEYLKRPTVQVSILLEISKALNHNFFKNLSELLPAEMPPLKAVDNSELLQKIAELEKQLEIEKGIGRFFKEELARR